MVSFTRRLVVVLSVTLHWTVVSAHTVNVYNSTMIVIDLHIILDSSLRIAPLSRVLMFERQTFGGTLRKILLKNRAQ